MITLAWLQGESSKWKTSVANRVSEIQNLTNITDWFHIRSEEIPAHILSRCISITNINNQSYCGMSQNGCLRINLFGISITI